MSDTIADYFAALERLKKRKAKINNDTVAIEAGRKKGSIKKSRPQFVELIAAIESAYDGKSLADKNASENFKASKDSERHLQTLLDASLAREMSLLNEVYELRKELASLRGGKIFPIRENFAKEAN